MAPVVCGHAVTNLIYNYKTIYNNLKRELQSLNIDLADIFGIKL